MSKTVLITGSSRGIGRSIALQLAKAGYQVAVNGTQPSGIDRVVAEIRQSGGEALGYCANVADPDQVTAMVQAVVATYGSIDVLIHNAGNLQDRKIERMTDEQWKSVIDVHLNGAFYCIRRVLSHIPDRGGDILLVTSTAGLNGSVGQVNYSAAKAGILGIVWTLAEEQRHRHIRVNAIAPAALTDMTRPVIEHLREKYARRGEPFPAYWEVGDPEDVARFVSILLDQPDKDLTGEIFGINGTVATQWQRPSRAWSMNDPASFFKT